jgi:pyruvate dehydrogenase E2 component (dihydrolipoamide acetyltransferase)
MSMNTDYSTPEPLRMPSPTEKAAEVMGGHKPHASPSLRAFARELGVDLTLLQGSGPNDRITFDDVKLHVRNIVKNNSKTANHRDTESQRKT